MSYAGKHQMPDAGRKRRHTGYLPLVCLAAAIFYLEFLLRLSCKLPFLYTGFAGEMALALVLASVGAFFCFLPRSPRASRILCVLLMELFTLCFVIAYFMDNSYSAFMSPAMIFQETGNVVTDFGDNVKNAIIRGLPMILAYHAPVLLFLLFSWLLPWGGWKRGLALLLSLVLAVLCVLGLLALNNHSEALRARHQTRRTYDSTVRSFGLLSALLDEISSPLRESRTEFVYSSPSPSAVTEPPAVPTAAPTAAPTAVPEESEPPVEKPDPSKTGPNKMDLDFSRVVEPPQAVSLSEYIQTRTPTEKNRYTGIFKGKNLILITAEAFSREVIDPELTPTLYRMATRGIVFEDFYQPSWGGSTSTGEYSWLTGIAPTNELAMMMSFNKNLYFTMGNQLQRLGYFSRAYHNGSYDYYERNTTHQNLGYSEFIGVGNGLEEGLTPGIFPNSDKEMIEYTLPQYLDRQPFSVYYMTISGHASYAFSPETNDMSMKNMAVTENLPYSSTVNAYLACNLELEYAMESLLRGLEEAGAADDTVIALVPDHYPYGLSPSAAWGNAGNPLAELYGYLADTPWKRDHNAAIIWCGSLEKQEPIRVSGPVSSLDILPTLSNLFGLEYDSRLLAGSDVFSDAERLVFWNDYSWLTERGSYNAQGDVFTPAEGTEPDPAYLERIHAEVRNRINLSWTISEFDYYRLLFGEDTVT